MEQTRYTPEFHGRAGEFFGIWIVNLVLTVLTLGIYSAWAKVRTQRYFYSNTRLAGAPFDYLADPITILKGRLIAYAVLIVLVVSLKLQLLWVVVPLYLAILVLFPWLIQLSLRFRARYSAWRGLRFRFDGTIKDAYTAYMWLPILAIGMWWLTERPNRWRTVRHAALLTMVAIAVCLPWWIHNVQVLGEFRPLGTQGAEQLSAAYSDEAFARRGMWFNLDETEFFRGIDQPDPVQRTLARAQLSEQSARTWVGQHPFQAACLWPARVFQEFRPHGPGDLFVLVFAGLGLAILWKTPAGLASRWLIAGQVLAIAATWSVAGRFVFPLLGILHLLATIGLWGAYVALVERREMSRQWILRKDAES